MEEKILEVVSFNLVYTSCYSLFTIIADEGNYFKSLKLDNIQGAKYYATEYLLYLSQLDVTLSKMKPAELAAGALFCSY